MSDATPESKTVSTDISLTPRILGAMLTGGNTMGINWAAKLARIADNEVPRTATLRVIATDLPGGGDDIMAALLPPSILAEISANPSDLDEVRDGVWPEDLLNRISEQLFANDGELVEEVYANCDNLMQNADTTTFYWNANYIIHMLAVENLDSATVRKAATYYERFADSDPVGSLFALFMLALLGPDKFSKLIDTLA